MDIVNPTSERQSKSLLDTPFGRRTVVDIDSHYSEPHDLWTKRAPARLKDLMPRVANTGKESFWVIGEDHRLGLDGGAHSTVLRDGSKLRGMEFMYVAQDDVHLGCHDAKARVALMDELGITAQILYPNVLGFGGLASPKIDEELRLLAIKIFNDAMAELQADSGERVFPMALLPWWDVKQAVAEATRAHQMGLRGININPSVHAIPFPNGDRLPDLGHAYWFPLWELCEALELPVNFHIGANSMAGDWTSRSTSWPSTPNMGKYLAATTLGFLDNASTLANLVVSGLFDRFEKLKFVSVESGLGWVPFLMEGLDYQYTESGGRTHLRMLPSEYVKKHIYTSFWFERRILSENIRAIGPDNVMFETDFPHPTCLYPIDDFEYAFNGLSDDEINKVLSGNAKKLYKLPI